MPRISLHFIPATMSRKGSLEGAKRIPGNILTWPTIAKPCCWQNFFFSFTVNLRYGRKTRGALITSSRCDEVLIPEWPKASG